MKLFGRTTRVLFCLLVVFTMVFCTFGYVPAEADSTTTTTYSFDEGLGDWTTIDADGDGHNWFFNKNMTSIYDYYAHIEEFNPEKFAYGESGGSMGSGSYFNGLGELSPDNYLVSPRVELGGSISFYTYPIDTSYCAETIGVFVSTGSNNNPSDFVEVQSWTLTAEEWKQYTVDLSGFSGEGYVAIRHYNSYDMYIFFVDEVTITSPAAAHEHDFTYTGEGDTITATCTEEGCDLENSKVSFSIVAPEKTVYGDGKSPEATLSGVDAFNEATGLQVSASSIQYSGRGDTEYAPSETAPTTPGTYTATIVAGEDQTTRATANLGTASVDYEILPAELTITADAKEKNEGETDPELTYTASGLLEGDTITGALERESGEDPGEYDILIGTISAGDNYTIKYVGAKFTIKAKETPEDPDDPEPPVEPEDPSVPQTGDDSGLMIYFAAMLASLAALKALAFKKRYNR